VALHSIDTRALTFENLCQMRLPLGRCVACRPGTATLWWADDECIPKCPKGSFSVTGLVPCTKCPRYTFSKVRSMVTAFRQGISSKQTLHVTRHRTRALVTSFRQHTLAHSHQCSLCVSSKQALDLPRHRTRALVTSFRQHTLAHSHQCSLCVSNQQTLNWTTY
jgi:hypothetical protein